MPNNTLSPDTATARDRLERALQDATPHPWDTPLEDEYGEAITNEVLVRLSVSAAHDLARALEDYQLALHHTQR